MLRRCGPSIEVSEVGVTRGRIPDDQAIAAFGPAFPKPDDSPGFIFKRPAVAAADLRPCLVSGFHLPRPARRIQVQSGAATIGIPAVADQQIHEHAILRENS